MTEEERYAALSDLAQRLRTRIRDFADELDALPLEPDEKLQALITWRCSLLTLIWDVSEAPLSLAPTREKQIRSSRIITRCLLEYGMRLEYYAYAQDAALKDWKNAEAWLKGIVKGGTTAANLARWSKEERQAYNLMIKVDGQFEYEDLAKIFKRVYEGRGYSKKLVRRAVRELNNFYAISSSFVHGSQGIFYDILEQPPEPGPFKLHFRSFRLKQEQILGETVSFLIQAIRAESVHRKRHLGADMYARESDLITGNWEAGPLGAVNPHSLDR